MNPKPLVVKKEVGHSSSDKVDRFDEGTHCLSYREATKAGCSGESSDKRVTAVERVYPEMGADIELAHCFNYGNWRLMKSKSTKSIRGTSITVWKCADCGAKLQKTV